MIVNAPPGSLASEQRFAVTLSAAADKAQAGQRFKDIFSEDPAVLLQRLEFDGSLTQLPAWQRLAADVQRAASEP
ncbi:hypothetical protein WME91_17845 [Sorangium sp. So ce269]